MSDHPKEAQRELRRIVICADICLDVFDLLPPAKVGLALALVCHRFDALADAHFRTRRWALGQLKIVDSSNGEAEIVKVGTVGGPSETLPIAHRPLPNGVVGFGSIRCWSIDDQAIAFLRRIGHLFQSDVALAVGYGFPSVWPLLTVSGIVKMEFKNGFSLERLRRIISPTVLRDCANLRFVYAKYVSPSLQFPPDDNAEASVGQALSKWLFTPRDDGQPKTLRIKGEIPLYWLKMEFRSASTGVSFIIHLLHISFFVADLVAPFELENSLTSERLTMRPIENIDGERMVVRSPIAKNAEQWAEWERKAMEEKFDWKVLQLYHDS